MLGRNTPYQSIYRDCHLKPFGLKPCMSTHSSGRYQVAAVVRKHAQQGALINLEQEFSEPAPVFTCLAKTIIEHGSSRMADDRGVACSSGLTCCVNLPRENFFTAQS